ncbi:MAG: hypothetical protein K2W96_17420 [Gemmataceae bacterium]|nr:hypothetical protein [Gemmataceae bacterium]
MAKKRSRLADLATYLAVRVVACIVQALPWSMALSLARFLGWLAYRVDRRHRRVALENLRHAFPGLDEAGRDRLVRASYEHLMRVAVEMIRMPVALSRGSVERHLEYADPADYDRMVAWVRSGRPLIVLAGHFGNWEMMSYVFGLMGFRGAVVARRLDNPWLDRFVQGFRRKTGQEVLDKNLDFDRITGVLDRGGFLGLVGDQDAGPRGMFVDFFGRPASTFKSMALLSLRWSAPVLVFGAARVGDPMRYRLYVADVILPEEYEGRPDAARLITERHARALETLVRLHPEQYFWLHNRWKHQRKEKRKAA